MFTYSSMIKTLAYSNQEAKLVKNDGALFGLDDLSMRIAETVGAKPMRELFKKTGVTHDARYGGTNIEHYQIRRDVSPSVAAVLLGKATKEDLAMFACMANPDLYTLPSIQTAIMDRLSSIHTEESAMTVGDLTQVHQAEMALFTERAELFTNTQTKDSETFYHADYVADAEHKDYVTLLEEQKALGIERIEVVPTYESTMIDTQTE